MGIISIEKVDHLYWLGRYTERVYTTLRKFFHIFDELIEQPEGFYGNYCERLNIPNIYTSNDQFVKSYLFSQDNPDSLYSNMNRAYDNAIVLRDELSSNVLSYIQMALYVFEEMENGVAPVLELQSVLDDLNAFWGCADDYVASEECRNILKSGKLIERLDLYVRFEYHMKDIEKEYCKLVSRLQRTHLEYNQEALSHMEKMMTEQGELIAENPKLRQEFLDYLGQIIEVM